MAGNSAFAIYEVWRILKGLLSFASSNKDGDKAATVEAKITQQTTSSILPTQDDEAIDIGLDVALKSFPDGENHLARINAVRAQLNSHQRKSWREKIGALKLPEKYKRVLTSRKVTETGQHGQQGQQPGQQPRGGQPRKETHSTWENKAVNYAYTAQDLRVQHLLNVSELAKPLQGETAEQGVVRAIQYLINKQLIFEESPTEKALRVGKATKEVAFDGVYNAALVIQLGNVEYDRVTRRGSPMQKRRRLNALIDAKALAKKQAVAMAKQAPLPGWVWMVIAVSTVVFIGAVVFGSVPSIWTYFFGK